MGKIITLPVLLSLSPFPSNVPLSQQQPITIVATVGTFLQFFQYTQNQPHHFSDTTALASLCINDRSLDTSPR